MGKKTNPQKSAKWHLKAIARHKELIKQELDAITDLKNHRVRLRYALGRILELESDKRIYSSWRRFIYIMSALIHHKSYGGLTDGQIRRLHDLAIAILRVQGVTPYSKLASFHAELQLVMSQIYRKSGQHWMSLFFQQACHQVSRRYPLGGDGFQSLALGIRELRLGYSEAAKKHLLSSEEFNLEPQSLVMSRICRVVIARLSREFDDCYALVDDTLKQKDVTKEERRELLWQQQCARAQQFQDLAPLQKTVGKGGDHHFPSYILEAKLWIRSCPLGQKPKRFPSIKNLSRKHNSAQKGVFLYKCAIQLEQCYDTQIPLSLRMLGLGRMLSKVNQLRSIESELLVWAAASRWLANRHLFDLSSVALGQYRDLSLRISFGKYEDCLGLVSDIMQRSWFLSPEKDLSQQIKKQKVA